MVIAYLSGAHQRAINETRHALSVKTGRRMVIAILLGGMYLVLAWTLTRNEEGGFWLKLAATMAPLIPFLIVYFFKFFMAIIALKGNATGQSEENELSGLTIKVTDILFDLNGLTEFYIAFKLSNVGIPSTIKNAYVTVYRDGECLIDKLPPRLTFAPLIQDIRGQLVDGKNPSLALIETGKARDLMFTFTYDGNAKHELGKPGTRFRFAGFDISGREVSSDYNIT